MPRTYTAQQVAGILQMDVREVYRGGANGVIPGRRQIGGRTRFDAEVIDALVRGEMSEHR